MEDRVFPCYRLDVLHAVVHGCCQALAISLLANTSLIAAPVPLPAQPDPLLEVHSDATAWSCRIDEAPALTPDSRRILIARLTPGHHQVTCNQGGMKPFTAEITAVMGARVVLRVQFQPIPAPPPPQPAPPPAPRRFDVSFGGGFGPAYGILGIGIGARFEHFGVQVGTGLYPVGAAIQYFFRPDATGFYVSAGYLRIGPGLAFGGSEVTGHEVFATGGVEMLLVRHLELRIGAGAGYEFGTPAGGDGRGPLVFDLSAAFLP